MFYRPHGLTGLLVACAIAAAGCVRGPAASSTVPHVKKPSALASSGTGSSISNVLETSLPAASLTGKVKIISDNGGGLIGNNGGNLISDSGGGIVSDNGGGVISNNSGNIIANNGGSLISNNGGGLTAKTKYGLLADAPKAREYALADATITLTDAAGKPVVDENGQPITATSDKTGNYAITAKLPPGNLVMHIKIGKGPHLAGGELTAMLPHQDAKHIDQPIDTSTSLGAAYVLGKYVQGDQKTYDKLPAAEAEKLRKNLDDTKKLFTGIPNYQQTDMLRATEQIRAKAPPVSQELDVIKALLLGQSAGGDGRKANTVALFKPRGLALDPKGNLLVGEPIFGRIRSIAKNGVITTLADVIRGTIKQNFPGLVDLAVAPDGTMYVVTDTAVLRVDTDNHVGVLAGELSPVNASAIQPHVVGVAPDGTVYVGENGGITLTTRAPRIVTLDKNGTLTPIKTPDWGPGMVKSIAFGTDGTLYYTFYNMGQESSATLYKQTASGPVKVLDGLQISYLASGMVMAPDGTLYISETFGNKVTALAPDGTTRTVAGSGGPENTNDLVAPDSMVVTPDGTLYFSDSGTGLVHSLAKDGTYAVVAGTKKADQAGSGDLRALAISAPFAVTYDKDQAIVVSERGNFQLARFDGSNFVTIAGTTLGPGGDGGPAKLAQFSSPAGIVYAGGVLYVADAKNARMRAIDPDGTISTTVGQRGNPALAGVDKGQRQPAAEHFFKGQAMALGPDGLLYWVSDSSQILRLTKDGYVELVAGAKGRGNNTAALFGSKVVDGSPAVDAFLSSPRQLAFGPDGDLYVATMGDLQIHKIHDPTTATSTISTIAGAPISDVLAQLGQTDRSEEGLDAKKAMLAMPFGLTVDAKGNVYVGEIGTVGISLLATLLEQSMPFSDGSFPPVYARVRKISPDGKISSVAGPGTRYFPDSKSEDALVLPTGLSFAPDGRLVIVDTGANLLRILPAGSY